MHSIYEISDFLAELNVSELSSIEKVKVFKKFLAGVDVKKSKENADDEANQFAKKELQGFQDMAHFESTTPW